MNKRLASLVVDYLERRGVEYVFGLCGHTVIEMLDALEKSKSLRYISVRHEQIAATAADGYARVAHKAGVVLCHLGPGITNTVTGVANAAFDSIPLVVIAGDVPSYYYGRHPHQEVNMHCDASQYDILKPIVKRAWRLDRPEAMPEYLDRAFRLAESGRPGPVLISVPMDMFSREVDDACFARTFRDAHEVAKPALSEAAAETIAKALLAAKSPIVHAGGGVLAAQASEELAALVEFLDIPVTRTLMGQGALSDQHPLMVGMTGFWGTDFVHGFTREADVILALGTRFAEADSSSWYGGVTFCPETASFYQIDLDPAELGRNYPVELGAIADIRQALPAILAAAKRLCPEGRRASGLRERIAGGRAAFRARVQPMWDDGRFPLTPQRILRDVRETLPEGSLIFTDVGWNKNGVGQQFDITEPGTIHHPSGLATMGFGPAAVLGAKLAAPDRCVVTLVGDGGFGANPSVMATAVEQNIPVVWIVMNNSAFGTIAGLEYSHYATRFGTVFHTPDGAPYTPQWADVARAYGVPARRIGSAEELIPALREAFAANTPYLIDCPMENIAVPTEGVWNINDIYTPRPDVCEGRYSGK